MELLTTNKHFKGILSYYYGDFNLIETLKQTHYWYDNIHFGSFINTLHYLLSNL